MPDSGDALFGPLPAAGDQGIGGNIDVGSGPVLMPKPGEIPGLKRAFQGDDPLDDLRRGNPAKNDGNRLVRREASVQEFGSDSGINRFFMRHVAPRIPAQRGTVGILIVPIIRSTSRMARSPG